MSDSGIKAESKSILFKKLLDMGVGAESVEKDAATKIANRINAQGHMGGRGKMRRRGEDQFPKAGCVRNPTMIKTLLFILLTAARDHERLVKKDYKFVRKERLMELQEEERLWVTSALQSRRDILRNNLQTKMVEKIAHLSKEAWDCTKHKLCDKVRKRREKMESDESANIREGDKPKLDPGMNIERI